MAELTDSFVRFQAQAWINNYAVDVDAEGETRWPLSVPDLAKAQAAVEAGNDLDFLRESSTSPIPAWVRNHSGPSEIYLETEDE